MLASMGNDFHGGEHDVKIYDTKDGGDDDEAYENVDEVY